MRWGEVVGGIMLLLLAVFALVQSVFLQLWAYGGPGPGLFPFVLGVLLAPMSLVYLGSALRRVLRDQREKAVPTGAAEGAEPVLWGKVAGYVVCMTGFALGLNIFGTWPTMGAAVFLLLAVVERTGWVRSLVFALLFVFCSYLLFARFLAVPLPSGTIW